MKRVFLSLALMALVALGVAPSAHAAAPSWTLQLAHSPSQFERLDEHGEYEVQYRVTAENSGDQATAGTYTVADVPPDQLTVKSVSAGPGWTCTTTEEALAGMPLTCSSEAALEPGASTLALDLRMNMSPSAPDTVTNEATISGGGPATAATAEDPTEVIDRAPFAIKSFSARAIDESEHDYAVAGGHPYRAVTDFSFPTYTFAAAEGESYPVEDFKDAITELPPGFIGNPAATPRCSISLIEASVFPACPPGSQVGLLHLDILLGSPPFAIFNVAPQAGYPAEFAAKVATSTVALFPTLRPRTGSYGISIVAKDTTILGIRETTATLFGVPAAQDASGGPEVPFLSNPVDCADANPISKLTLDSWQHPGTKLPDGSPDLSDPNWKTAISPAPPVTGCEDPALAEQFTDSPALAGPFKPITIDTTPVQNGGLIQADRPAGLRVDLDFPQSNDPTNPEFFSGAKKYDLSTPQAPELKDATVKLPAGLSISPSAADGLGACSDLASAPAGDQVHYDNTKPVSCPDSSKVGTVTATTPLLAAHDPETDAITGPEPVHGDVYILAPHPGDLTAGQDGHFRLLIQIEDALRGINLKLPGITTADKSTGQLTATFTENPQLPVSHLELDLNPGRRAPLATPVTCGKFTTTTDLVPWSTPGTPDATPASSFTVGSGPNGSPCVTSPRQRPFAPTLSAGTESNKAGASSPFVMKLTRADGEQEIGSIDLTTPKGFTAKLAGVPYCPELAIAAASSKSGAAEQASPSCPTSSQIGTVTAGAGPGTNPYYVTGKAYLAGPYKGAPLSVAFITPALAGPFDLGNVVVRAALQVNPETTQVTVKTDPLPQILDGVPLRLRSVVARIDRPNFALNPTNCEPMTVNATVAGASGASASPSNAFQVGSCKDLRFAPKLHIDLKGGTRRDKNPALTATLTYPKGAGYANVAKAQVTLPHSEILDQSHIGTVCTRVQFAAKACPKASIYGHATAVTPLLDQPLSGPVYLRSSNNPLPDLVADLNGQIEVTLAGKIDTGKNGGIRNTFQLVPDAPVSKFVLKMQGGDKGLLVNSENICKKPQRASVNLTAQNGRISDTRPLITNDCKSKGAGKGKRGKAAGHRRALSWLPGIGF